MRMLYEYDFMCFCVLRMNSRAAPPSASAEHAAAAGRFLVPDEGLLLGLSFFAFAFASAFAAPDHYNFKCVIYVSQYFDTLPIHIA